jgi:hypothetical protein
MVFTVRMRMHERPTSRRTLLRRAAGAAAGVAAGIGLAGCDLLHPPTFPPAPADPLTTLYDATVGLIAAYEATSATHPTLAARLTPLREDHRAHAMALATDMALAPDGRVAVAVDTVPTQPVAALAALLAAEQKGIAEATEACLAAPAWRAPLLASIAACRTSHLDLLS